MFKKSYNRAILRLRIDTLTPLLIKAGDAGLDPTAVDLSCVRTRHAEHGRTVYIPGSSLKGVVRSAAEASVRGKRLGDWIGACDNPLQSRACQANRKNHHHHGADRRNDHRTSAEVYQHHCLCCRLFGSTDIQGRAGVRDLFPWSPRAGSAEMSEQRERANRTEIRYGVSIDRVVGSVKNGPFELEIVPAGAGFWGEIALLNYQVYQLGLLFHAFDELNHGFAQLGSNKSRGLGVVTVTVESILHEQSGTSAHPLDVADLATTKERVDYGLLPAASLPETKGSPHGLATRMEAGQDTVAQWRERSLHALRALAAEGAR